MSFAKAPMAGGIQTAQIPTLGISVTMKSSGERRNPQVVGRLAVTTECRAVAARPTRTTRACRGSVFPQIPTEPPRVKAEWRLRCFGISFRKGLFVLCFRSFLSVAETMAARGMERWRVADGVGRAPIARPLVPIAQNQAIRDVLPLERESSRAAPTSRSSLSPHRRLKRSSIRRRGSSVHALFSGARILRWRGSPERIERCFRATKKNQ